MTVSLKDMMKRLPAERQRKIRARANELIAEETARTKGTGAGTAYQVFVDANGGWRWRLVASNGKVLATSGEAFRSKRACLARIGQVRSAAVSETIIVAAA